MADAMDQEFIPDIHNVVAILGNYLVRWLTSWWDVHNLACASPRLKQLIKTRCRPFEGKVFFDFDSKTGGGRWMGKYMDCLPPARTISLCLGDNLDSQSCQRLISCMESLVIPYQNGGRIHLTLNDTIHLDGFVDLIQCLGPRVSRLTISDPSDEIIDGLLDETKLQAPSHCLLSSFTSLTSLTVCYTPEIESIIMHLPAPELLETLSIVIGNENISASLTATISRLTRLKDLTITFDDMTLAEDDMTRMFGSFHHGVQLPNLYALRIKLGEDCWLGPENETWSCQSILHACPALEEFYLQGVVTPPIEFKRSKLTPKLKTLKMTNPLRASDLLEAINSFTGLATLELHLNSKYKHHLAPQDFFEDLADALDSSKSTFNINGSLALKLYLNLKCLIMQEGSSKMTNTRAMSTLCRFLFKASTSSRASHHQPRGPTVDLALLSDENFATSQTQSAALDVLLTYLVAHITRIQGLSVDEVIYKYLTNDKSKFGVKILKTLRKQFPSIGMM